MPSDLCDPLGTCDQTDDKRTPRLKSWRGTGMPGTIGMFAVLTPRCAR
jgi:hypothetical protein